MISDDEDDAFSPLSVNVRVISLTNANVVEVSATLAAVIDVTSFSFVDAVIISLAIGGVVEVISLLVAGISVTVVTSLAEEVGVVSLIIIYVVDATSSFVNVTVIVLLLSDAVTVSPILTDNCVVPLFSDVIVIASLPGDVCFNVVSSSLVDVEAISLLTEDIGATDAGVESLLSEVSVVSSLIINEVDATLSFVPVDVIVLPLSDAVTVSPILVDNCVVPLFSDVIVIASLPEDVCTATVSSPLVNVEAISLLTEDIGATDAGVVSLFSEVSVVSSLIINDVDATLSFVPVDVIVLLLSDAVTVSPILVDNCVIPLFSDVIVIASLPEDVCTATVSSPLVNVEAVSLLTEDIGASDAEVVSLLSEVTVVSSIKINEVDATSSFVPVDVIV